MLNSLFGGELWRCDEGNGSFLHAVLTGFVAYPSIFNFSDVILQTMPKLIEELSMQCCITGLWSEIECESS